MLDGLAGLKQLSDTYLRCRLTRHAWEFMGIYRGATKGTVVSLMHCRDCDAIREQPVTRRGEIDGNRYTYPEGYLLIGAGKHRIMPIDVRREMLRRYKPAANREALLGKKK